MMGPLIVAEMGASHLGDFDRALRIVGAAKEAGADAVKLQTWGTMTVCERRLERGPWAGTRLTDLYERCRTPWDWHARIFEECRARGMVAFSTPFDHASVDFLETLGCPLYKIASFEITYLALIKHAASTGKPLIISTGMATEDEIEQAVDVATEFGAAGVTLLRCVSAYPAEAAAYNVITMAHMLERFGTRVGLSDHTVGSTTAVVATALGAEVIERHLSLDQEGPDGGFASTPREFAQMVRDVRAAAAAVGRVAYGPSIAEVPSMELRRSLWVTRDVAAGEALTAENMAVLRPGDGLAPERYEELLGARVTRDVPRGTPVSTDFVQK
jgi:pseudaminic acid synthase